MVLSGVVGEGGACSMPHSAAFPWGTKAVLTLILLTTTIVAFPSNVSKWQMGFNSAFKGLMYRTSSGFLAQFGRV
jgi:hypothetical protein